MKKLFKRIFDFREGDEFNWLLFLITLFVLFASFTCKSAQPKTESKQLEKNSEAITLNDEAEDVIKNSDLPQEDKQKIFSALGTNRSAIIESSETIAECIEFKSQAVARNAAFQATIKKQGKIIFGLCVPYAIIILYYLFKILYRFTPAGAAVNQLTSEIKSIKEKIL